MVVYCSSELKAAKKRRKSLKNTLKLLLFAGGSKEVFGKCSPKGNHLHITCNKLKTKKNETLVGGVSEDCIRPAAKDLSNIDTYSTIIDSSNNNINNWSRNIHNFNSIDNDGTVDRCYQCILCPPMFFSSKKKRLWRARVKPVCITTPLQNSASCLDHCHYVQNQQQPHLHQAQQQYQPYPQTLSLKCRSSNIAKATYQGDSYAISDDRDRCYESGGFSVYDDDQTMSSIESTKTITTATVGLTASSVFRNCCGGGSSASHQSKIAGAHDEKARFQTFVAQFSDLQLATLCQAMENDGFADGRTTDCVLLRRKINMNEDPNVIACRIWRWPDMKSASELKRIPSCPNNIDQVYICCNPHHWSRLCFPDTPPPPYQRFDMEQKKSKVSDHAPSEGLEDGFQTGRESLPTDGENSFRPTGWCQLAYWEQAQRVGDRFPVENSAVNVFSNQPRGDGMCLKILADQRRSETPEPVHKARQKIGLGITLSQETDGVWLYNRSSASVFIHSPTLNNADGGFHVSKVLPGYCLKAFDNYRAKSQKIMWSSHIAGAQTGPMDIYSMRISFAKGWGRGYTRQDVTGCPCWLEVLLRR